MKYKTLILGIFLITLFVFGAYYFFRNENITNYPSKGTDIIAFGDSLVVGVGSTNANDFVSLLSQKIGMPIINLG
ncbi:MAG: arylesterase, partial [Minisyncoccia bacterium]